MSKVEKVIIASNYFSLGLLVPIINLVILERGANLHTLPLLLALYSGTVLLFELPSGIFADLFGRKNIFLMSCVFQFLSTLLLFMANNVLWLVFVLILNGLGRAFSSGSIDALIIDQEVEKKGELELSKVTSTLSVLEGCGLALGGIAGGIIASISGTYNYNLLLRMIFTAAVILLCICFVKDSCEVKDEEKKTSIFVQLKSGKKAVSVHPNLWLILSGIFLTGVFLSTIETYWQPAFKRLSDSSDYTWLLGIISFLGFAAATVGNVIIGKIMGRLKDIWWSIFVFSRLNFGGMIILFSIQKCSFGFILGYTGVYLLLGISNVAENTIINKLIPNQFRASFLSLSSLILQIGVLSASILSSVLIHMLNFNGLWLLTGILILVHAVFVLVSIRYGKLFCRKSKIY